MRDRSRQAVVFGAWTIGVPAVALGMFLVSARLVSIGAWALLIGVTVATVDNVFVVGQAGRASRSRSREAT